MSAFRARRGLGRILTTSIFVISTALAVGPAGAETIGITSAVNLNAVGTPPAQDTRVLQVGLDMFANEKVDTGEVGQTHLIFDDGSALTIGPSSTVILDEFVYDPDAEAGKLVASVGKGLMRFVGGKISKKTPVLFKTPNSLIGIRGGIAIVESNTPAEVQAAQAAGRDLPLSAVTLIFGLEAFMQVGEQRQSMVRPGSRIVQRADGTVLPPAPVSQDTLDGTLAMLEDRGQADVAELVDTLGAGPQAVAQIAPAAGGAFGVGDDDIAATQLADLSSNNDPTSLVLPPPPNLDPTAVVDSSAVTEAITTTNQAGSTTIDAISGVGSSSISAASATLPGLLSGRAKHASQSIFVLTPNPPAFFGTDDVIPGNNLLFNDATTSGGVFNAGFPNGESLILPVGTGAFQVPASTAQPFGSSTLFGTGTLSDDNEFLIYELFDPGDNHRIVAWAGTPTPASAFPTSGVTAYELRDDFGLVSTHVPFVPFEFAGDIDAGQTPTVFIEWTDPSLANPSFYGSTIVVSGQGPGQLSVASTFSGTVFDSPSDPRLLAEFRGSFSNSFFNVGFDGTAVGGQEPGESNFYGSTAPNNFVLQSSLEPADQVELLLPDFDPVPYFPNAIASITDPGDAGAQQTTRTLNGFFNGFSREFRDGGDFSRHQFVEQVFPSTSDSFSIVTDAANNTVSVQFDIGNIGPNFDTLSLQFGGSDNSAFIDDDRFVAIEPLSPNDYDAGAGTLIPTTEIAYVVTGDQVSFESALPSGVTICDCAFTTWGFAGLLAEFADDSRTEVHLLPWVAGEIANTSQFNTTVNAIYNGTAVGTSVLGDINDPNAAVYKTFGDFSINLAITPGQVTVIGGSITNYDGGNITIADSVNTFSAPEYLFSMNGTVRGNINVSGDGTGSFVGPGTPPANTIGQGGIGSFGPGVSYSSNFVFFAEN